MDEKAALGVREVAALLSVDGKPVYRLAKRRELPGFKVAGLWRYMKGDIEGQKNASRDPRKDEG